MMKVNLNTIQTPDVSMLQEVNILLEQVYNSCEEYCTTFEEKYPSTEVIEKELFSTRKAGLFLVSKRNDVLTGFISLQKKSESRVSHTATLSMGIRPEYRGEGIGAFLMEKAMKYCPSSIEIIYLMVRAENKPALSLYKKQSFKEAAYLSNDFFINGKYSDGVLMRREMHQKSRP